jgi:hypothetical protein
MTLAWLVVASMQTPPHAISGQTEHRMPKELKENNNHPKGEHADAILGSVPIRRSQSKERWTDMIWTAWNLYIWRDLDFKSFRL